MKARRSWKSWLNWVRLRPQFRTRRKDPTDFGDYGTAFGLDMSLGPAPSETLGMKAEAGDAPVPGRSAATSR
ncbi:hypothetical protein C7444_106200 [Sphaerotilus hippei]|uniref:Uncharacterized protein n=1 Tax=Sphaerotilus hippei TaxID=744406 RepID=A0A318H1E9_9BURK|nr:hypothetical protein [Sphaerotilus hippei]PXW96678.1 hypothetical protein C7444_106200 [Sphaerotilus hippei]